RVCSLEVAYIGWNEYGSSVHWLAPGSNLICAKPFPWLAVMEPDSPVVRSWMTTLNPSVVSSISTVSLSPELMKRSVAGLGVNAANGGENTSSGAGEECGTPLFVMKAKLSGSKPTRFRQSSLFGAPVFWSRLRLKMFSAAHHFVASQLFPAGHGTQPG